MRCLSAAVKKLAAMFGGRVMIPIVYLLLCLCFAAVRSAVTAQAPDKVTLAVYDACRGELSQRFVKGLACAEGVSVIECASAEKAEDELLRGRAEVLLTVNADLDRLLTEEEPTPLISLVTAPGSVSAELMRETAAGALISARTLARVENSLTEDGFDPAELSAFMDEFELPRTYTVKTTGGGKAPAALFGSAYACYEGIAALALLLLLLSLSKRLGDPSSRLVAKRLLAVKNGGALAFFSDLAAVFAAGLIGGALAFAFAPERGVMFALGLVCYVFCISGLCLLLSRLKATGRMDIAAPFIALATSVAGGCFADLTSLSPALRAVAMCTPQGQLIAAAKGEALFLLLLLFEGLALLIAAMTVRSKKKAQ